MPTCHLLIDIDVFMKKTGWDYEEMQMQLLVHIVEHMRQHMDHIRQTNLSDKPWWTKSSHGKFSVKNAWKTLRKKDEVLQYFKKIWVKGLAFKIFFFWVESMEK